MTPKDILRTDVQVETTLGWLKADLLVHQGKDKVVQRDLEGTYLVTHVNCKAEKPPLLDIFQPTETAEGIDPDPPPPGHPGLVPHSSLCLTGGGGHLDGQVDTFILGVQSLVIQDGLARLQPAFVC